MNRPRTRFPRHVYGGGDEPDVRFSLANERTFLAGIRTSLALLAAGVALETLSLPLRADLRLAASLVLLALGTLTPVLTWRTARSSRGTTARPGHRHPARDRDHRRRRAGAAGPAAAVTPQRDLIDPGRQPERTLLAWRRTSLALLVASLTATRLLLSRHPVLAAALAVAGVLGAAGVRVHAERRARAVTRPGAGPLALLATGCALAGAAALVLVPALAAGR